MAAILRVNRSMNLPAAATDGDTLPPGTLPLAAGDLMLGSKPGELPRPLLSTDLAAWSVTAGRDPDEGVAARNAAAAATAADAPRGLVGSCMRTPALRAMALTVSEATGPDPLSNDNNMTSAACNAQVTASAVPVPPAATACSLAPGVEIRDCLLRCRLSCAKVKGELGAKTSAPIVGQDGRVSWAAKAASKASNCACSAILANTGASVPCSLITGCRKARGEFDKDPM
jgi:hypothetical protein